MRLEVYSHPLQQSYRSALITKAVCHLLSNTVCLISSLSSASCLQDFGLLDQGKVLYRATLRNLQTKGDCFRLKD